MRASSTQCHTCLRLRLRRSLAALRSVGTAYYALTQTFIDRDIFAGKDQSIWNMMPHQSVTATS